MGEDRLKVSIIGAEKTGKTTLCNQLVNGETDNSYQYTLGD